VNPIENIRSDRQSARSIDDTNADICFLALSEDGQPSVRTLVLRDVSEEGFTLFINKSSPKWRVVQSNSNAELLLWYTSIQKQYRIRGTIEELERSAIEANWPRRPTGSKYLDFAYEDLAPQSSPIDSRRTIVDHIEAHKARQPEDELDVPPLATGIILRPETIDCLDLNHQDRIHDRQRHELIKGRWQTTVLVP
jgi:pyridoxamine 5'-phosphate oxidase